MIHAVLMGMAASIFVGCLITPPILVTGVAAAMGLSPWSTFMAAMLTVGAEGGFVYHWLTKP